MEQVKAHWTHPCLLARLFSKCHLKVSPPPPSSLCPQFYPSFRRQPSATKPQCGAWLAACIQQLLCSKFWASHSYPDSHLSYVFCLSCSTASWARRTTNWPAWTSCRHCGTVSLLSPVVCAFPPLHDTSSFSWSKACDIFQVLLAFKTLIRHAVCCAFPAGCFLSLSLHPSECSGWVCSFFSYCRELKCKQ